MKATTIKSNLKQLNKIVNKGVSLTQFHKNQRYNFSFTTNPRSINNLLTKSNVFIKNQKQNYYSNVDIDNITMKKPVTVSVTGASGNIGYAIAFRIAAGDMLGPDQPIDLKLIDIPLSADKLKGIQLELEDCSFPTLNSITCHTNLASGFHEADIALIIGIANTVKGGERVDGLKNNAEIMIQNARALSENAHKHCKTLVVGNPVNTNCLIMAHNAPNLKFENFNALSRLDHNRAVHKLADHFKVHVSKINKVFVWGNHDATMYPELEYGTVNNERIKDKLTEKFMYEEFPQFLAQRWKEIITYRCLTSCASAANSAIDHMRNWCNGTSKWVSKAVYSDGSYYNAAEGVYFSFPVVVENGEVRVIRDLELNERTKEKIKITSESLLSERKVIEEFLKY